MIPEEIRERFEAAAGEHPIYQYEFFRTEELEFSENVRYICETECPMFGKSWSCPPGCGTVEECRGICGSFEHGVIFSTVAEVNDASSFDETLPTRAAHTEVVRDLAEKVFYDRRTKLLSCESCTHCAECSYPEHPCRFPEKMMPCIEAYGIITTALTEKYQMDFYLSSNTVLWFGIILF